MSTLCAFLTHAQGLSIDNVVIVAIGVLAWIVFKAAFGMWERFKGYHATPCACTNAVRSQPLHFFMRGLVQCSRCKRIFPPELTDLRSREAVRAFDAASRDEKVDELIDILLRSDDDAGGAWRQRSVALELAARAGFCADGGQLNDRLVDLLILSTLRRGVVSDTNLRWLMNLGVGQRERFLAGSGKALSQETVVTLAEGTSPAFGLTLLSIVGAHPDNVTKARMLSDIIRQGPKAVAAEGANQVVALPRELRAAVIASLRSLGVELPKATKAPVSGGLTLTDADPKLAGHVSLAPLDGRVSLEVESEALKA